MSDSDDTDVLLLIPNDFFSVEDQEAAKFQLQNNNITGPATTVNHLSNNPASTAFEQYCTDNMESTLNPNPENENILEEIDSYLNQIQQQPHRTMYCDSSMTSEIPSLKYLWHTEGPASSTHKTILEERLRRRHLEKNLEATQMELIDAQQKVSVALSVDQAKDVAIGKLRTTIKILQQQAGNREDELQRKCRELEVDLRNSLEQSKRLKEVNELLEGKISHLTTAANDIREINKKQLEDLQTRLSNSLKAEQLINDDLVRTRNQLVIEKNCHRDNQETWTRKEANYKGEQETLRASLKHYYQKQLNDVVNEKLREFQTQMDELSGHFKSDFLLRERQIAERAIQQMELIYKKNEEEVRLLTEKHQEEIKFVQLQLEMAQTTISEAQQRLMGGGGMTMQKESFKESPKKILNSKKFNNNINGINSTKRHSPELQGHIDTLLKKSPNKFNSTRRTNTPLKR